MFITYDSYFCRQRSEHLQIRHTSMLQCTSNVELYLKLYQESEYMSLLDFIREIIW